METLYGTIPCPECGQEHTNPDMTYIYPEELAGAIIKCPTKQTWFTLCEYEGQRMGE